MLFTLVTIVPWNERRHPSRPGEPPDVRRSRDHGRDEIPVREQRSDRGLAEPVLA
jgi:hypothetical protein